jgi:DNA-binding NarL/FixJ family response regulator
MCGSTNTIKTHTKAIYRKIGVSCRDDAIAIARSHGILQIPISWVPTPEQKGLQ